MNRDRDIAKQMQKLISMGKQKGYVTYDEVNDHMPENVVSSDQIDDWLGALGDEGIEVVDGSSGGSKIAAKAGKDGAADEGKAKTAGRGQPKQPIEVPALEDDEEGAVVATDEEEEKE